MFFFPLKHPTEKSRGGAAFAALKKCGTFENGRQLITTEKEHDSIFYDSYDSESPARKQNPRKKL